MKSCIFNKNITVSVNMRVNTRVNATVLTTVASSSGWTFLFTIPLLVEVRSKLD
jgi:hypothetical protein